MQYFFLNLDNNFPTLNLPTDDVNIVDGNFRVRIGIPTSLFLNATDADNDQLTYSLGTDEMQPPGVEINQSKFSTKICLKIYTNLFDL